MQGLLIADLSETLSLLWMIGAAAGGLGLVIFVHELGHFLAAKACGIKCEKFYIGFDIPIGIGPIKLPSALARFRWGETEYGIGILPLGGYVKMLGQDDDPRNQVRENEKVKLQKSSDEQAGAAPSPSEQASSVNRSGDSSDQTRDAAEDFELDPRSLPAKPVWQRMIVFSAGVIMNLVFAVIFAAVAYRMGVSYTPCILGGTAPGDPAWVQGIEAGDKIIQIGRTGWFGSDREPDEHLRFDKDLMINVILNGANRKMDLLIRGEDQSQAEWISLSPSDRLKEFERPATLGVRPTSTTKLSSVEPCDPLCKDEPGYAQLRGGDEIIAVDGRQLPRDAETGAIFGHELEKILANRVTEPLKLTVRRRPAADEQHQMDSPSAAYEQLEVTLPPNPLRTVGLIMEMGPIVGVRKGTPAEQAGFRAGDELLKFNDRPVGDPFTLAQRLLPSVGEEVEFTVRRQGAEQPLTLQATLVPPATYVDHFGPGSPVSLECLGIAFEVQNVVQQVDKGSPAEKQGLRAGDKVLDVQFLVDGEKSGEPVILVAENAAGQQIDLPNWAHVHTAMNMLENSTIQLTYRRGEVEQSVPLLPVDYRRGEDKATVDPGPVESDGKSNGELQFWYHASRRLNTMSFTRERTSQSWLGAWKRGYAETTTSLKQVLVVLQKLFTGQLSYKSMGGPIMIARAAGAEASHGLPRLLIFLTFLSANLAVLNFLPIPALDGGHLMFLAAEAIRGKPVNERLQVVLTLIGVGCLLSLMVLVFALDIHRLPIFQ